MFKSIRITFCVCLLAVASFGFQSCRSKKPYNPFLHSKTKPSASEIKENKKVMKHQAKMLKHQNQKNRKHLFGKKNAPKK